MRIIVCIYMCVFAWTQTAHTRNYYHPRSEQFGARALRIPLITTILTSDTLSSSTKHTYQLSAFCVENTFFKHNILNNIDRALKLSETIGNSD